MKPKVLIFCQSYPNPEIGVHGSQFAHVRVRSYLPYFDVRLIRFGTDEKSYIYDGVPVHCYKTLEEAQKACYEFNPQVALSHFVEGWMYPICEKLNIPLIVWVHGSEAHAWYRVMFIFRIKFIRDFLKFMFYNFISLKFFRKLIKLSNKGQAIHFVFVSEWMRKITRTDTLSRIKNFSIIPNPVDTHLFKHTAKDSETRKKILLLRSFNSTKYANDISVKAILHLSKEPFFNELEFRIIGMGDHFERLTGMIKHLPNVKIENRYYLQDEIPSIHKDYGIFLCPTRTDSQGVSMCEAMSSGLVPLSSKSTGIPEFVTDGKTGFMTRSYKDLASKIAFLYHNPDVFMKMSEAASTSIAEIAGVDNVIEKEVALINTMIERKTLN